MNYGTETNDTMNENCGLENLQHNEKVHSINNLERPSLSQMMTIEFYKRPVDSWFVELCEGLFKIRIRGSTIKAEIYYGLIHYISCFYCLAVIPPLMKPVGYDSGSLFLTICLTSGIGCLFGGIVINFAAPTVVSIFLASYLKKYTNKSTAIGSDSVIISGCKLIFLFQNLLPTIL
jgi:hypothetical protein